MRRIALTVVVVAVVAGLMVVGSGLPSRAADPAVRPAVQGVTGVEVPALRTENSSTYRRADGSFQARISTAALNYRDASGAWQPIDNDLRTLADGSLENRANGFKVRVPAKAAGGVRVAHGGHELGFSLIGAGKMAPVADGPEATFADALPHVDVAYEARGSSLKETLTLDSAAAPAAFAFALDAPGLRAVAEPSGGVSFRDSGGHQRFRFAAPWMLDAKGALSHDARYVVSGAGSAQTVQLRLDREWLDDPDRSFPVKVDPTVSGELEQACQLISGSSANVSDCGEEMWTWVGRYEEELYRSLITIPALEEIVEPETLVTDASLRFWFEEQTEPDPGSIELRATTRASDGNATWNRATSSTAWATAGGDLAAGVESTQTLDPEHIEEWTGMGATRLAQGWVDGSDPIRQMIIKASDEEVEHTDLIAGFEVVIDYRFRTGVDDQYTYDHVALSDGTSLDYNVASGNVILSSNDGFPTSGDPSLMLSRFWSTQDPADRGTFGVRSRGDIGTIALHDGDFGASYWLSGFSGADEVFVKQPGGSFVATDGKDRTLTPNEDGSVTLRLGETRSTWEFARGSPHRLVRVRQNSGYTIDATYDETGRLSRLRDSNALTATFAYTEGGDLRTVTDQAEGVRRYAFDGSHRLTSYTSPAAAVTRYTYDGSGRLTRIDMPDRTAMKLGYAGGSSVVTGLTPVNAENRDLERTSIGGEPAYTTITHPRTHDVTYFHDNRLHVDVIQPGDGPGIAASGDIVKPAATYDKGAAPYTIDVKAAGIPNGVEEVHLSVSRSTVDTLRARCEAGCPMRLAGQLAFDSRRTEGTYDLQLTAEDGEANRSTSDTWTVHVDRTAPAVSASDFTASYDAEATETQIDWDPATDPDLADETPGSPITSYSHRYRLDSGEWSTWTETDTPGFTIEGTDGDEDVDVEVTASDAAGNVGSTASDTVNADPGDPPSLVQAPEIWGSAMVGEDVRGRGGRWSSDTPLRWAYAWQSCNSSGTSCEPIEAPGGPSADELPLTDDDIGSRIRVKVTVTNAVGSTEATSDPTAVVVDTAAPEADAPPQIASYPLPGVTLVPGVTVRANSAPSRWYPWLGPTVERQWQRCNSSGTSCTEIEGETDLDYTLTEADEGKTLRVEVASTNRGGSASTTSDATAVVHELEVPILEGSLPAPTVLSGDIPWEGLTLQAHNGAWGGFSGELSDADSNAGRSFQWLRCDEEGTECDEIEGAIGSQYTLVQADDDATLRVEVTATNAAGEATESSAATDPVQAPEAPEVDMLPFQGDHVYTESPLQAQFNRNVSAGGVGRDGGVDTSFQWSRCDTEGAECEEIEGATERSYTPTTADVGHTLRVEVTAENRIDSDSGTSDPSPVVELAPTPEERGPPVVTPEPYGNPTLSGDPVVGLQLAAEDNGIWSEDLASASDREWQWQRCLANRTGCTDIAGGWTRSNRIYIPHWRDVGYRLRVRIARFAGHGQAWATSEQTAVVRAGEPRNLALPAIAGEAFVRESLSTDGGRWDPTSPALAYQWLRCDTGGGDCHAIDDAHARGYEPVGADVGATLRVRVTATLNASSRTVTSAPTDTIGAAREPENVVLPSITGTIEVGESLLGHRGTWQGAVPLEYAPQWLRCDTGGDECEEIDGATEWWYDLDPDDVGSTVRFQTTSENDIGSVSARSAASGVVPTVLAPTNTAEPAIRGTADVGETLRANEGRWSHHPTALAFQWQACNEEGTECEDVEDATDDAFHVRSEDEDSTLRVVVTASNSGGETEAPSDPTAVVGPMNPPANVEAPGVWQLPYEGWELRAEVGRWSGGTPRTYTYQWRQCDRRGANCEDISGADERTYVPVASDVGNKVVVRVRATNDAGYAEATSSALFTVQRGAPHFVERVAIGGDLAEGGEAEADTTGLRGSAPIELTYQWLRCDESCNPIEGATAATYEPVTADVGAMLRLTVTAENEEGEATSRSQLSAPIEPAVVNDTPRSAGRPQLEGLPRVTETLVSTLGEWRGQATVTKAIQWQRCDNTAESCVNISGATEEEYEVDTADEGKRLRTVVEAENERGTARSSSLLTPPMKPEVNTAFVLDEPVALEDVADAIDGADAIVLSVDYDGGTHGGYSTGDGAEIEDVLDFFDAPWNSDGLELPITKFSLAGSVQSEDLDELAVHVAARLEVPSIRVESRPLTRFALLSEDEGTPLVDPYISDARLEAYGADCTFGNCDEEDWEHAAHVPNFLEFPRVIEVSFTWRPTTDLRQRMAEEVDRAFGWEFNLKLHNGENGGLPSGIACWPWDKNDFWIDNRDLVAIETSMPSDVGVYWDTDALDTCDEKDLTFGVYHPELLERGVTYSTTIYLASPGDEDRSTFSWKPELLARRSLVEPLVGAPCDFSPWCVNVPGADDVSEGKTLIGLELDYFLPGCYEYNDEMEDHAGGCVTPN